MKRFRIQLVIAFIVFVCGVSLMGLVYIFFNQPETYITPGIVVTAPNPVATPIQNVRPHTINVHYPCHTTYPPIQSSTNNAVAMPASHGLYTTSSAKVHSVGGGSGYGIATTSQSSSSTRGISYSSTNVAMPSMPSTSFTALASQRQVAEPEAVYAPQMASLAVAPHRAPPPPNPGGGGGLDPEHQLIEQPIGDGIWIMLILACAYLIISGTRRREQFRIGK